MDIDKKIAEIGEHTPEPWEVDLETGEISKQEAILGRIYGADDFPCCEEDINEECKSNARLVALAPELLNQLKECRETRRTFSKGHRDALKKMEQEKKALRNGLHSVVADLKICREYQQQIEQSTIEACIKAGWEWVMRNTCFCISEETHEESFKQAIDSVGGKA